MFQASEEHLVLRCVYFANTLDGCLKIMYLPKSTAHSRALNLVE